MDSISAWSTWPKAMSNTSSYHETGMGVSPSRIISGRSSHSAMLSLGKTMILDPAALAAADFSLKPPIWRTLPVRVISPVMQTSGLTGLFKANEIRLVAIAIPADGPSFLTAPSGKCVWSTA
ncbi:hypothetical protein AWJ20_2089 [Sugiyamaella lignohabitans]|uniref:Uncharacterized protein n=1 Tax=Sugiyamaella lignohabitans TaxID=796027 RepID=A0A167EV25_9ASCO|nr:uncharacterized protein AWJ20_2089 [Sugiyamaella lignohabitans]ANB14496.1 hypothetical protein AWJ20_2089 [Sugiyamaella lignohabitans]